MSLPAPTVVIFDMDGTTVRHINPKLLGLLEWLDDTHFKLSRFFNWLFRRKAQGPIIIDDESIPKKQPKLLVHRVIHKLRRKPVEQIVEPCPGIYSVLEFLKKNNIPMAIVSNGLGKGYGHDILEKFDLEQYFSAHVFREDISKSKPHPEPILLGLKKLDLDLKDEDVVWYIGDRHKDVLAALAARDHVSANIVPIAYALNAAAAVLEKNIGTDHIMMSYYEIYDALKDGIV